MKLLYLLKTKCYHIFSWNFNIIIIKRFYEIELQKYIKAHITAYNVNIRINLCMCKLVFNYFFLINLKTIITKKFFLFFVINK